MSHSEGLFDIEAVNAESPESASNYGSVYRFIRRRVSSREEAEDLTQDVFLDAANALRQARLREGDSQVGWLYTVARRRLIDRLRAGEAQQRLEAQLGPASAQSDYEPSVVAALLASLQELDSETRRVIVMKLFEGRRFKEIATARDSTEEACRARFSRGLAVLRERLREKGVTP